jgi:hypothetical protein
MQLEAQKLGLSLERSCKGSKSKLQSFQKSRGKSCWTLLEYLDPRSAIGLRRSCAFRADPEGIQKKYVRENKAVAVDPVWVLGVESHELVEHNVSHRGHAHRGARVARVGLECGIDLQTLTY